MNTKKRKLSPVRSQYHQKYKHEWENELKWLKVGNSDTTAMCVYCSTQLNIGKGGLKDLRRHETTECHQRNKRAVGSSATMNSFLVVQDHGTVDAELRWANFVSENHLSLNLSDAFSKLVPKMFPDSKIASNFKCCRTKTGQIIQQALGETARDEIVFEMKQSFFTLMMDESTDKATVRQMVIMARIFAEDKVETHLYRVVAFDGQATGENLFNIVNQCFEEDNISWKKCLSMSSDGARAMVGEFNSVLSRVKKQQEQVWFLHCTCHVAHLAASHACNELPDVCEQLTRDVYAFFKMSGKRQSDFREIQTWLGMETHKILRPCFTRWLALLQCVERLIEQWPALQEYFDSKIEEKESKLESVQRIRETLHSNAARLYFLFLQATLPRFTTFNTMFQHERPFVHKLHYQMCSLLRQFIASFVKFQVIQKSDYLNAEIDYSRPNQLNNESIFIGNKTRTFLENEVITQAEKEEFYANVRDFFERGTRELYRLLPYKDQVLKNISILDPSEKSSGNWEKIQCLTRRFPNVVLEEDMDSLNTEFMAYSLWDIPPTTQIAVTDDIDHYWAKVSKTGEFPTLCKLAKAMLILPHSNAEVERVFSKLTLIKTSHRTLLGAPMLNALMHCSARKSVVEFQPTNTMRARAKHLKK